MADCMSFPKTMNEFLEGYSFKDTDEVYTNGSELIQVFRVKQGLEHYEAEIRAKAIEDFAVALKEKCKEKMDVFGFGTLDVWEINKIAKELKKNSKEMKGE